MKVHEIDDGYEVEFVGKVLDKTSGPGEVEIMKFQWKKAVQLLNINECGGHQPNIIKALPLVCLQHWWQPITMSGRESS